MMIRAFVHRRRRRKRRSSHFSIEVIHASPFGVVRRPRTTYTVSSGGSCRPRAFLYRTCCRRVIRSFIPSVRGSQRRVLADVAGRAATPSFGTLASTRSFADTGLARWPSNRPRVDFVLRSASCDREHVLLPAGSDNECDRSERAVQSNFLLVAGTTTVMARVRVAELGPENVTCRCGGESRRTQSADAVLLFLQLSASRVAAACARVVRLGVRSSGVE